MNTRLTIARYLPALLIAALLAEAPAAHAVPIVSIDAPAGPISVGDTVNVTIGISGAVDLYAYQFDLAFDPLALSPGSVVEGGFLSSFGTTFFIPGSLAVGAVANIANTLIGPVPGGTGSGSLATLTFMATGEGMSSISLANLLLLDSGFNLLDAEPGTTSISIGAPTASVPEPSAFFLLLIAGLLLLPCASGSLGRRVSRVL